MPVNSDVVETTSDKWLQPLVLENAIARLEPLELRHHDALVSAVRDGEL